MCVVSCVCDLVGVRTDLEGVRRDAVGVACFGKRLRCDLIGFGYDLEICACGLQGSGRDLEGVMFCMIGFGVYLC